MPTRKRRVLLGLSAGVGIILAVLSWQTYQPPTVPDLRKRINYLERIIREGTSPQTELMTLGRQNPEWALFSLSFAGFAFANLAQQDTSFRAEAAHYLNLAIVQVLTKPVRGAFEHSAYSPIGPDTTGSVLYLGHLNLMLGAHRQLVPNSRHAQLHDILSGALYRRYGKEPAGCLPSYPGRRWVPDNAAAIASLSLHSRLTGSAYAGAARRWVERARRQYTDSTTGLLVSEVDSVGNAAEEPRGSMLGWSIWFLTRFDSTFARTQYELYKQHFSTNFGVLRLYKERPGVFTIGLGDIDSGPLFLGYSIPANAFVFADAVALHDGRNARRGQRLVRLGSHTTETATETRYAARFVDLPVSPMAEALLLWAETGSVGTAGLAPQ